MLPGATPERWEPTSDEAARTFLAEMGAVVFSRHGEWIQFAVADATDALVGELGLGMAADGREAEGRGLPAQAGDDARGREDAVFRGAPCREWRFGLALDT